MFVARCESPATFKLKTKTIIIEPLCWKLMVCWRIFSGGRLKVILKLNLKQNLKDWLWIINFWKSFSSIYNRLLKINEWNYDINLRSNKRRLWIWKSWSILIGCEAWKPGQKSALIAPLWIPDLKICCINYSKEIITSNYHFLIDSSLWAKFNESIIKLPSSFIMWHVLAEVLVRRNFFTRVF